MHIRKLELQGFKSFADRGAFHFGPGISGVVGPNGCGKSNVVDAVRWCIGEQSAKSLRGDAMSDVIFAGSATRKPVGFAEVSLTFVAGEEPFPGVWQRYAELEVTRRLYRDGASEYLVNQEKVRLRDIADLFLDTGVGNRLYSFIEQGRIGQIVHARPEQRRTLIEEAAGISRYKARREESMEKLASTRASLERVADLADEMGRQLRGAERAVQRALKARSLGARVRQEELGVALGRFSALAADRRALGERLRAAESDLGECTRAVMRHEEDLAARRTALDALEGEAGHARDRLAEAEAERRVEESAAQYQERESGAAAARLSQLATDQQAQRQERDAADAEAASHAEAAVAAERALADARAALEGASDALRSLASAAAEARSGLEQAKRHAAEALEGAVRARGALAGFAARRSELQARAERHRGAAREVVPAHAAEEVARQERSVSQADAEVAAAQEGVIVATASAAAADAEVSGARQALRTAENALAETMRERDRLAALAGALAQLDETRAELPDRVRAALAVRGVHGVLADAVEVPPALVDPVARALDGGLDTVLVPDVTTAIDVAHAGQGGRLRVLVTDRPGEVRGLGSEIRGTDAGRSAIAALLPDLHVAADVAAAFEVWRPGSTVVTRDAAVLRPDGCLVLGGELGGGLATLRRREEIATLRARADALPLTMREADLAAALTTVAATEASGADARGRVEQARESLRGVQALAAEARHRLRAAEAERTRALRAAESLAAEAAAVEAAFGDLACDEERGAVSLRDAEARFAEAETGVRRGQVALEAVEPRLVEANERVINLRMAAQAHQKDALAAQAAVGAARARSERSAQRSAQIEQERSDLERRRTELALEAARSTARLQHLGEEQARVHGELEALKERVREAREALRVGESAARAARERRDTAKDRHVEAESALTDVRAQLDRLRGEAEGHSLPAMLDRLDRDGQLLVEGYAPDPAEVELGGEPVPTLRLTGADLHDVTARAETLASLREQLARAGDANPTAIDEYREVAARHTELARQQQDLADAMDVIEKAIAKINKTCRERFRETFDLVDDHFRQVYPRLVGGGFARLELTDEEDLLTCGVEVVVQPPGKRVQNLSLLSGGEKAMAAIALIFSLFRVKPSPFCLLDEVDAPLDEGNGARFNDMLREMSRTSQFIVITHNKKTMECADVLYGVTMPEAGTSRLVTVRLE